MSYDVRQFSERQEEIKRWLQSEYAGIQSGTVTPSFLKAVTVEVYGAKTPLNHCASITSEGSRTLLVTPYDISLIENVESAIQKQVPSVSVSVGTNGVRVTAPELTGERREVLQRFVKERAEEAKRSVRGARQDVLSSIKMGKADGDFSEEEEFAAKKQLQEYVDKANESIDEMCKNKIKDIQI